MKTRAAVARQSGAPPTIATVGLEGPRAGAVPVHAMAAGIDPLVTHVLKLEDIYHGFELMERGESIRSLVVY